MKYEWRKRDKELYLPKKNPVIIEIPEQKFIMLKGVETQILKNLLKQ
ncbi:hypothetical protein ACK2FT_03770 [Clostridioides difficile]